MIGFILRTAIGLTIKVMLLAFRLAFWLGGIFGRAIFRLFVSLPRSRRTGTPAPQQTSAPPPPPVEPKRVPARPAKPKQPELRPLHPRRQSARGLR